MIKQKKKNRILLIFCTILVCLCSIISFIPFNQKEKISVSADEVVTNFTFTGSNFSTPHYCIVNNTNYNSLSSFRVIYTASNNIITSIRVIYSSYFLNYHNGSVGAAIDIDLNNLDTNNSVPGSDILVPIAITASNNINGTITMGMPVKLILSHHNVTWSDRLSMNRITYIDANDNQLRFNFYFDETAFPYGVPGDVALRDMVFWQERTYFLTDSFSDNEFYEEGYNAGYNKGYNDGDSHGWAQGVDYGQQIGEDIGYNNGYSDGLEESNQYSFLSLISATIDAPVKYFQSLFNFELLGVNLQGFLTGLFTLCVIITIFKLCLGG